jgi:predicted dehydrogenase
MRLRGAIIGLGKVAVQGHLPGWLAREDVAIVAATDTNPAREAELRRSLPDARWYPSVDALLAGEPLDFVDICTPPTTHAALVRGALEGGPHVLCEKPLVTRPEDLRALAELAAARGRVLHTVHNWHHAPVVRGVTALLQQGAIGEVRACTWHTLRAQPAGSGTDGAANWRVDPAQAGGGILVDHGWHVLYLVQAWLGEMPKRIRARLETRRHTQWPLEDTALVDLDYDQARAEILLTWAADERRNWARLEGTRGGILVEDDALALVGLGAREGGRRWPCPPALSSGSYHPDWFGAVADAFIGEVSGRSERRARSLEEARHCAILVAAAQASHRQGGVWLPVAGQRPLLAGRESGTAGRRR